MLYWNISRRVSFHPFALSTLVVLRSPRCLNVVDCGESFSLTNTPPDLSSFPPQTHIQERGGCFFSHMLLCAWCIFLENTNGFHFEVWNARALWKTLSGAADVVKSSLWREAGEDRYGPAAVGFSLRVLIHTHPTAASYTLPPSQWRSCCRSPTQSIFQQWVSFGDIFPFYSSFLLFAYLSHWHLTTEEWMF